ncbi:MAG: glycosyltransferase family 4 protein, partial [Myxococcota bacterium]|nr:glycosyltransferase family 4 protein [Myxococcota bacterium]
AADTSNQQVLQSQVAELGLDHRVHLRFDLTDAEKEDLLDASDFFFSPIDNLQETFGISIVEAMARGLPVLASDFDGYRELVEHGITGFRIPTTMVKPSHDFTELTGILEPRVAQLAMAQHVSVDVGQLVSRMRQLANSPDLRDRLGTAGRERVRETYTWRSVLTRYEQLWAELAERCAGQDPTHAAMDPALVEHADIFQGYPTHILGPESTLHVTELGQSILDGHQPLPAPFSDMGPLLSFRDLRLLLERLRKGPVAFEQLRPVVPNGGVQGLESHVGWLLKYGLIRTG